MNETRLPETFSMDLSYVVATLEPCDDAPVYRGPVVLVIDGATYTDAWLGDGLEGSDGPELTPEFWQDVEHDIRLDLERRGPATTHGEYRRAMTVAEVRAEIDMIDTSAAMEEERAIAEVLSGELRRAA